MNTAVLTPKLSPTRTFDTYKALHREQYASNTTLYLPRRIEKLAKKSIFYSFWVVFTQPLH